MDKVKEEIKEIIAEFGCKFMKSGNSYVILGKKS